MTKGVTIIRDSNKRVPTDYLAKALGEFKSGVSLTCAVKSGSHVMVRKTFGEVPVKELDALQVHNHLKDANIILHLFDSASQLTEEDISPFVLLQNEDEQESAALVAVLEGDFSRFDKPGSSHTPEYHCVHEEIFPRLMKLVKATDGDLDKIMDDLSDDITASDYLNFMIGKRGVITFLSMNGRIHSICHKDDKTIQKHEGWWTSNSLESSKSTSIEKEMAAKPISAKPKLKLPSGPKIAVASTTPINAAAKPAVSTATAGKPVESSSGAEDALKNPDSILELPVPAGMDERGRLLRWASKRIKDLSKFDTETIQIGMKSLCVPNNNVTVKFLSDYQQHHKLGMDAIKLQALRTTAPVPDTAPDTAKFEKSVQEKISAAKKIRLPGQSKSEDTRHPVDEPTKKITDPAHIPQPDVGPSVVTEPLPVFSPDQKKMTMEFQQIPSVKLALDKHHNLIASPKGLEELEKKIHNMKKQFGNVFSAADFARWDYETMERYGNQDVRALARAAFWLAIDYLHATKMLDELTEPAETKHGQEVAPQQPTNQPAAPAQQTRTAPKIKLRKSA